LDEVLALPSAQAAEIALRTQQVLLEETGVADVADPLGGSWYVEAMTDRIEAQAEAIFERIRGLGSDGTMTSGILRGIESGFFTGEIAESAFVYQLAVEKGTKRVVGVNVATDSVDQPLEILRVPASVESIQVAALVERRSLRDAATVSAALADVGAVARGDGNLVEPILAAARAEATLGEICDVLRDVWGTYTETASF
jgi:methylmalonyl-CoA mutase N-terminal domain/subunit